MKTFPIHLTLGHDLHTALQAAVEGQNCRATCVLSADLEILSLSGTVAFDGATSSSYLHMALSTSTGQVLASRMRQPGLTSWW